MASRSWQEEIRNGRFNFNMIQLPPDRKQALDKLEQHIKTIIDSYEEKNKQSVTHFYIGKSSVPYSERLKFDIDNPHDTWEHKRIQSRWYGHKTNKFYRYTTMVVIAVVTDDTLPERIHDMEDKAQKYCLSLESWLIDRFKFEIMDNRIVNDTSNAGREAKESTIAYVLYVVMELEHPPHEHVSRSPSRRKNCGNCRGCLAENCGLCEHCKDMPKFGGPGIKKQRCIRRQCLFPLESPLESSWQQLNETERNVVSNKTHQRCTLKSIKDAPRNNYNGGDREKDANRATAYVDRRSESKFHSSLHAHGSPKLTKINKYEQKCNLKSLSDMSEICPGGSISHGSLQSSRSISSRTHEYKQRYTQESTSESKRNYMHMHDRERITERHRYQHNHLKMQGDHERSMELQARLQNVHSERKVEAHASPKNLGRKRTSGFADMQFSESPLKRRKMDCSAVVTSSHTNRARDLESEHSHHTFKCQDRPRSSQTKLSSRQYESRTMLNNGSRWKYSRNSTNMPFFESRYERHRHKTDHAGSTSRIVTSLQPSNRGEKSDHNSRRFKSHMNSPVVSSTTKLSANLEQNRRDEWIELLHEIESMQTEEMSRWFDALAPKKRSEVEELLKRRKPAIYNKLMARSKTYRR